ncbi:hypothetical protein [Enterobacter cancerogenus]|uniref:hypothetical protein n=1 Tax=Enterobacter cancerogenus TaxID=69218 RepID=UPI0007345767|nr:hypothetical protein [Enterobacter cancerogenus]KTQ46858.1 hypothetical protein NS104_14315 [Enterobacter cancerogenus]KTQ51159.1 hypothetical protein NS111_14920 [Enterobacter cancerogenus]KTQ73826.1 hypothetical protein NS188_09945 [Enterobacter cancerogenus]KTQ77256.1 hypothetical protein NS31R_20630 [Enterobacter cancerogenus]
MQSENGNLPSSDPGKDSQDKEHKNKPSDVKPEEKHPQTDQENWLLARDNLSLIKDTRSLMGTRRYLLDKALDVFRERTHPHYSDMEQSTAWANMDQTCGGYGEVDISSNVLSIGVDNLTDNKLFGLSASITRGSAKGSEHENHSLYAAGAFYSWEDHGLSFGLSAQYIRLLQEINIAPLLGMGQLNKSSDIVAASVRAGYKIPGDLKGFNLIL